MTVRRRVLQKIRDRLMDARSAEPVIVFEKQINIIVYLGQIVDQARQDRCRVDQVVLEDQPDCACAKVRTRSRRAGDVRPARRIVPAKSWSRGMAAVPWQAR